MDPVDLKELDPGGSQAEHRGTCLDAQGPGLPSEGVQAPRLSSSSSASLRLPSWSAILKLEPPCSSS